MKLKGDAKQSMERIKSSVLHVLKQKYKTHAKHFHTSRETVWKVMRTKGKKSNGPEKEEQWSQPETN